MLRPLCEWKTKPRPLLVGRSTPDKITDSKAFVLELAAKRYQEMDQASKAGDAFLNAGKMIRSLCLGVGDVETYLELQTKDIANARRLFNLAIATFKDAGDDSKTDVASNELEEFEATLN